MICVVAPDRGSFGALIETRASAHKIREKVAASDCLDMNRMMRTEGNFPDGQWLYILALGGRS